MQDNRLIYLVEADGDLAQDLAIQISHFGYVVHALASLEALEEAAEHDRPAALIFSSLTPAESQASADLIANFRRLCETQLPTVFVSERGDLESRLRAVRAGGDAYFTTPVDIGALIDKLDALTAAQAQEPYRILLIEDGSMQAAYYAAALERAGMMTTVVNDAMSVMQPLVEFRPDLILMDMYMPGCDGMDLAAVIRQQEDFVGIPIVFFSAETNLDLQQEAIRLGGDDFLTKPIQPDLLIVSVSSRVQRSRTLRSLMLRDSLTGLLNHTAVKERLQVEVARARRCETVLSLAVIDIDHFKSVNDTYGHPVGDRVLKSLARLLQQRLRKTDVIGRYGGEEFVVILTGTDGASAFSVMDRIRDGLAHIRQHAGSADFSVTFSCGIASFPQYPDGAVLTQAADQALYEAKRGGRNRVVLSST